MAGKQIGLFFGSFNPVHNGHLMIANHMAEFEGLDQVWFVISPQNPFKTEEDLLAEYHRRELLDRAIGDYPKFRVSTVEFALPKPSYTINTLNYLKDRYPDHHFYLIMGSDQLPDLHRWRNVGEILDQYTLLVYPRRGSEPDRDFAGNDLLNHPALKFVEAPLLEISSSFIRESIRNRKDIRFFLHDKTWNYLDEMNFYR